MILEVSVSRIVSMLYIFRIYGKFANTFFKKCCQKSAKTKNCTTFPIILQMAQHYKPNIILFGVPKGMKG